MEGVLKMSEPVRVTEVLSYFSEPWKLDWYAKYGKAHCNRVGKASMKIGSEVDEIIKANVGGAYLPSKLKNKEVASCIEAYQKWHKVYQPKSIVPGTRLFATIDGVEVTGEPDLFVDDVLVDIKCSTKISPSYWVQVNMYNYLEGCSFGGTNSVTHSKVAILRLDKVSGSYEYVVKAYDPSLVEVWCGMMRAYCYFNKERNDGDEL